LGGDVNITGDIKAAADLHIDGQVDGDIGCAALIQGSDSHIKGQITAHTARLAGRVDGSINVGELIIETTAHITGDVTYESISVAPGSQVDGRFSHRSNAGQQANTDLKLVKSETTAVTGALI